MGQLSRMARSERFIEKFASLCEGPMVGMQFTLEKMELGQSSLGEEVSVYYTFRIQDGVVSTPSTITLREDIILFDPEEDGSEDDGTLERLAYELLGDADDESLAAVKRMLEDADL